MALLYLFYCPSHIRTAKHIKNKIQRTTREDPGASDVRLDCVAFCAWGWGCGELSGGNIHEGRQWWTRWMVHE
ncbi:MAG TPA: hypothetical protein PJ989_14545 [Oligoflexia bacterium]|nr:hypothetical protein [Oligoflexia bacterium]